MGDVTVATGVRVASPADRVLVDSGTVVAMVAMPLPPSD